MISITYCCPQGVVWLVTLILSARSAPVVLVRWVESLALVRWVESYAFWTGCPGVVLACCSSGRYFLS